MGLCGSTPPVDMQANQPTYRNTNISDAGQSRCFPRVKVLDNFILHQGIWICSSFQSASYKYNNSHGITKRLTQRQLHRTDVAVAPIGELTGIWSLMAENVRKASALRWRILNGHSKSCAGRQTKSVFGFPPALVLSSGREDCRI